MSASCRRRPPQPSCLGFIGATIESPILYTAAEDRVAGWNVQTGQQVLDLGLKLPPREATLNLRHWQMAADATNWLVVYANNQLVLWPKDVNLYAKSRAPRELFTRERARFLRQHSLGSL